jgi:hypothetical protein
MALARKYLTSKRSAAATANTRKKHKLAVGCVGWSDVAVQLVGGTRGHGPVRFVCPTPTPRRPPIGATHMNAEPRQTIRLAVPSAACCPRQTRETCSEARSTEGELDVETQTRTSTSSEFAGLVVFVVRNVKSVVSKLTELRRFPDCQSLREVMPKC